MQTQVRKAAAVYLLAVALGLAACSDGDGAGTRGIPPATPAAETSRDFGTHVLHYRAFRSDEISPQIARAYDLPRSRNRALVNIALVRQMPDTLGEPVRGQVELSARNLLGQRKPISIREIEDGGAIYYLGETSISHNETVIFELSVLPEDGETAYTVRFTQLFHTR